MLTSPNIDAEIATSRTFVVKGLDRLNRIQPGGQLTVRNYLGGLIGKTLVDSIDAKADGTYTFPTPIPPNAVTYWNFTQPGNSAACDFTKGKQIQFDPYTRQLVTPDIADIYCFDNPCGNVRSLGNAPAPKGLRAIENADLSVTLSWDADPWATYYKIYHSTDPRVVVNSPVTNFSIEPSGVPSFGDIALHGTGVVSQTISPNRQNPTPKKYYYSVTSLYTAPAMLGSCQSQASTSVLATRTEPTMTSKRQDSVLVGSAMQVSTAPPPTSAVAGFASGSYFVLGSQTWTKSISLPTSKEVAARRCASLSPSTGVGWRLPTKDEALRLSVSGYFAWHHRVPDYYLQVWTSSPGIDPGGSSHPFFAAVSLKDSNFYDSSKDWQNGVVCVRPN